VKSQGEKTHETSWSARRKNGRGRKLIEGDLKGRQSGGDLVNSPEAGQERRSKPIKDKVVLVNPAEELAQPREGK